MFDWLVATPVEVAGGWEEVRWHMRPVEVAAVVSNAVAVPARATSTSPLRARLRGPRKMMGYSFSADYLFDRRDGLAAVRLTLRDASRCEALYGELLARYGSPIEAARPLMNDGWVDRRTGNRVAVTDARADPNVRSCVVTFSPQEKVGLVDL